MRGRGEGAGAGGGKRRRWFDEEEVLKSFSGVIRRALFHDARKKRRARANGFFMHFAIIIPANSLPH